LLGLHEDDEAAGEEEQEETAPAALFDWVEAQTTTMVIPPDLSAAAATVLEGMPVTPLAFHLYWLRRAVDAQYEREVALASGQAWRYEVVPAEAGSPPDEVTVRVTRHKGPNSAPDAGESVEPPGMNGAAGWRVVRVDGQLVTLRAGSADMPSLPAQGLLAPRANRRVAEVKRETIDSIAGGRNGAATLRALMADPASAHCAAPGDNGDGAVDDGSDPGLEGHLYPAQRQAVRQATAMGHGDVLLIQGPPGTGKTTTIVAIVRALVAKGSRILLCSQSNLGVDNALERLHGAEPKLALVRVGNPELVLPSVKHLLIEETAGGEAKADRAPVVGGTCAGVALSRAVGSRTYDYVIVDEANKARMDEMMLACARGERLILVGDHNQLPPYPDEACTALLQAHPEASPLAGTISLFDWLVGMGIPSNCRLLLDEQNRMAPELAAFISETFYGGRVRNGPRVQDYGPVAPAPLDRTLIFVDTAGMAGRGERVGRGGSIANTLEADLVSRAVAWLDQHVPADLNLSLGVISGYREQVAVIRRLVARRPTKRAVHIDTVDSFEGREEDVIVASLVRSNDLGRVGFLREASRLNVALSRARRMLLIVGDSRTITASPDPEVARRFKSLLAHVYRHGIIVPAGSFLQPPRVSRPRQAGTPTQNRPRRAPRSAGRAEARPVAPVAAPAAAKQARPAGQPAQRPKGSHSNTRRGLVAAPSV
jgi:DNA polymerase III delta prime subunit